MKKSKGLDLETVFDVSRLKWIEPYQTRSGVILWTVNNTSLSWLLSP